MISFDFKTYLNHIYLLIFKKKFTICSVQMMIRFCLFFPILLSTLRVFYLLDNIFFCRFRFQKITSPIFIVGIPRSGTTFLFRLMSKDRDRFTYFRLYHILFPSICIRKFIEMISLADHQLNCYLSRFIKHIEKKIFSSYNYLHEYGFNDAEEDDTHFIHCFHTPVLYLTQPFVNELDRLAFFDNNLDKYEVKSYMNFYAGCIKRQSYLAGSNKTVLSKNVWGLGKLKALKDRFPGARFIYIIRNPYESIGSLLSFYYVLLQKSDPQIKVSPDLSRSLTVTACNLHLYAHKVFQHFQEDSYIIIKYEALTADPDAVVREIYKKWNIPVNANFADCLRDESKKNKGFRSKHDYSLEELGVSKEFVYERLQCLFAKYNFHR